MACFRLVCMAIQWCGEQFKLMVSGAIGRFFGDIGDMREERIYGPIDLQALSEFFKCHVSGSGPGLCLDILNKKYKSHRFVVNTCSNEDTGSFKYLFTRKDCTLCLFTRKDCTLCIETARDQEQGGRGSDTTGPNVIKITVIPINHEDCCCVVS
jgi:hypothetical protein